MPSPSEAFQKAVYQALLADAGVAALVGTRIYDNRPTDAVTYPAITFGPSDYVPEDMDCVEAREESLQIDCWTRTGKLSSAKALADAVKRALHYATLTVDTHAVAEVSVESVRTIWDEDLITGHGIVSLLALVEEH